ncbi:MAG: PQQ-dependent sugar dehydrogenase [Planctomycetes bacterium]|nr:PQQ-dependent sugar dehydrogenase [Planctomycetota bacterium]
MLALPAQSTLTTRRVATGLSRPIGVSAPIGDYHRAFILEQTGRIRILRAGTVLAQPFLDITPLVNTSSGSGERGLLGFAFHPDYFRNGFFYVYYTRLADGASMLVRYRALGDPYTTNVANAGSAVTMLGPIAQPFVNHNGGGMAFGPDGHLYLGLGDGGSAGDPGCRAQDLGQLLGKILRLNVDGHPAIIPPDNPFVGVAGARAEIWHRGTRNPWRLSFDRLTGDLYIGDVGQNAREEVDFQAAGHAGGLNYGWKIMEGTNCYSTSGCTAPPPCNSPLLTRPIHSYAQSPAAVIGGYVYRGCAIPALRGTYFFADYVSDRIWSFVYNGNAVTAFTDRTAELTVAGQTMTSPSSFGEDGCGELYICSLNGNSVHKIVPRAGSPATELGFGEPSSNGLIPRLGFCGGFTPTTELLLENCPGVCLAALVLSARNNPTQVPDIGLVVPYPPDLITGAVVTDVNGRYATPIPSVGAWVVNAQWVILDTASINPFVVSNAVRLVMP